MRYSLFLFIIFNNVLYSQSIYKSWFSDSTQNCIKINKRGFSQLNDSKYIKIKKKNNKLIIFRRYGLLQTKKYTGEFDIIKLTNDTLILSRKNIPMNERKFEELGQDIIIFTTTTKNCFDYLSNIFFMPLLYEIKLNNYASWRETVQQFNNLTI